MGEAWKQPEARGMGAAGRRLAAAVAPLLLAAACGSAPAPAPRPLRPASPVAAAPAPAAVEILSLELQEDAAGARVSVRASKPLTWTSYRDPSGALSIELPDAAPAAVLSPRLQGSGLVREVVVEGEVGGLRPHTRLVVVSAGPAEPTVRAEGEWLQVDLVPIAGAGAPAAAPALPDLAAARSPVPASPAPLAAESLPGPPVVAPMVGTPEAPLAGPPVRGVPASQLAGVEVGVAGAETRVRILGDGEFAYSTFFLEEPYRFVVDLPGVVNAAPAPAVHGDGTPVERVRMAQFRTSPERIARVVVDLAAWALPVVERSADGLLLRFPAAGQGPGGMPAAAAAPSAAELEAEVAARLAGSSAAAPNLVQAAVPAAADAAAQPPAAWDVAPADAGGAMAGAAAADTLPADLLGAGLDRPVAPAGAGADPPPAAPVEDFAPEPPAPPVAFQPEAGEAATPPAPGSVAVPQLAPAATDIALFQAAEAPPASAPALATEALQRAEPRAIGGERTYRGEAMTLSLKDADIKDVLRSFAAISGLNVVVQPGVAGSVTVELKQVPWDQALEQILKINSLDYELEGNILRIAPVSKLREEAEERQRLAQAQALSGPLRTVIQRVSYADVAELAGILRASVLSQRGSVMVDRRTNTLIVKELPDYMDTVIALIENLDTPEPQVMIEARIVETTKRFQRTLGISWAFAGVADAAHGNTTGLEFPNRASGGGEVNLLTGGDAGLLEISLGNILDTFTLDARLQAAENEGLINILSAPRVATLNNEQASIQSGLQIPIQTIANNTVSVQFVNATLRLDVTPHITAEGTVLMDINIQKREPQIAFAVPGASNAPIATKEARTRVIVRDGGTTVIGGIYEVSSDQGSDRVPGLANVPLLGHLFKNKRRTDENEELLIFITPRVIKL